MGNQGTQLYFVKAIGFDLFDYPLMSMNYEAKYSRGSYDLGTEQQ